MPGLHQRLHSGFGLALLALAALASPAMAADGEGLDGRTDDKVITLFCLRGDGVLHHPVIGLSLIQYRLDSRKERRKQDLDRLGRLIPEPRRPR